MTVLATAGTERGRALVVEQGAHHVFDHHARDYLAGILAAREAAASTSSSR